MKAHDINTEKLIFESPLISRDLSWLQFNRRVLEQVKDHDRTVFEKLKFLAITQTNLDEFFMVRVGSLYNYIDYGRTRVDYCRLREFPFRDYLFNQAQNFYSEQIDAYNNLLRPLFINNGFDIVKPFALNESEQKLLSDYFDQTLYPILTPMLFDGYHSFPTLLNNTLTLAVITLAEGANRNLRKLSFVQMPGNQKRFFEIKRDGFIYFVPIEEIVRWKIDRLFKNIEILSVGLFRLTRNADISIADIDDADVDFVEEVKRKLTTRRTARVVKIEIEDNVDSLLHEALMSNCEIEDSNFFVNNALIDFGSLWQIAGHKAFADRIPENPKQIMPLGRDNLLDGDIFERIEENDVLLHHPYNSMEPVLKLLEESAIDPNVLAIKITIYRLAKESRITAALQKAAEMGKQVSVLFEVKARFDEENNLREAERLRKAGCYIVYGIGSLKTHTKMMLIIRQTITGVKRYVHMSSGNYNEATSRIYTDIALITTRPDYGDDVSEFFHQITGHSKPDNLVNLITAPNNLREGLQALIEREIKHKQNGNPARIVLKANSIEDREIIETLYKASNAGVKIDLIIRGICCLRPQRKGLSENIAVRSIVGNYLEHSRIYYFLNNGNPEVFSGSADLMTRSFDRRIESLFLIKSPFIRQRAINILVYNLRDNVNCFLMNEAGDFTKRPIEPNDMPFNIHKEFYYLSVEKLAESEEYFLYN